MKYLLFFLTFINYLKKPYPLYYNVSLVRQACILSPRQSLTFLCNLLTKLFVEKKCRRMFVWCCVSCIIKNLTFFFSPKSEYFDNWPNVVLDVHKFDKCDIAAQD